MLEHKCCNLVEGDWKYILWYMKCSGCLQGWVQNHNKYSLLMHRITFQIPAIFLCNSQNVLWVDYLFSISFYYNGMTLTKKSTRYWRHYHSRCRLPHSHGAWRPYHELILQISRNIFLAFKWKKIWDQDTMSHIIRHLNYRFMWEIMTWSDDKTKLIHKKTFQQDYDYELLNPK